MRLIDADALADALYDKRKNYPQWVADVIGEMPTIDTDAMLKEQEAKKVTWRVGRAHCPSCGELFPKKQDKQYIRFCNYCGQAVKWE